jgi:2,4-dienoyl-CoA reductase-like NADH-dependent reductase (Old Yellow Enzyme family)
VEIKNRFVHSATYEAMASENGEVTDALIKRYQRLAEGEVGLIIPGFLYVHPLGRANRHQMGIHNDDMIPGLRKLADAVHHVGGRIAFQLVHAGRQTTRKIIGETPLGPSSRVRDPIDFFKPRRMTEAQINQVIQAFGEGARRAVEAGVDGVQIHAAHGYLVNQFLSPFFNDRNDAWGGSAGNRFRFLKQVILMIKAVLPDGMPLLVKLNTHDHTPREGITPPLARKYATWLAELGIEGLELSCGSAIFSYMNMCRGDVPVDELLHSVPSWKQPLGRLMLRPLVGKYGLGEGYNVEAAKMIRTVAGSAKIIVVGGLRRKEHMEAIIEDGYADFVSMSRPFIREPFLVRRFKEGKREAASCESCNKCLAAVPNELPMRCYSAGFPE